MSDMAAATTVMYNPDTTAWRLKSQLLAAIQCKDAAVCSTLLDHGVDVDQEFHTSGVNRPAIGFATERGAIEIVKLLIKFRCAINRADTNGLTPLHIATQMGYEQIVEVLLQNRANVGAVDRRGRTPLHVAALGGNLNIVKQLIAYGADIHRTESSGFSALGCACAGIGRTGELIQYILSQGASAQEINVRGISLLWNVLNNPAYDYKTVKMLIEHGAKPGLVSSGRFAPIHIVIENNSSSMFDRKWAVLDLILKAGCDVDSLSADKQTPLHVAVLVNDLKSVRILLRANANPNTVDILGSSPLSIAISSSSGMNEMIGLLLGAGARMSIENFDKLKFRRSMSTKDKEILRSRINSPMKLTEIGRKGFCQRYGPYTYDWICEHGNTEIPDALIPFSKYDSEEY